MATVSSLNEAQRRRLLSSARYVDKLLSEIEAILGASESKSIFPKYAADLAPTQVQLVRSNLVRFRNQLARALDGLGIVADSPALGSLHSVRVSLTFVRIAVQEMAPHYLRGYGEVPRAMTPQLEGLCAELEGLLERLGTALADGPEAALQARHQALVGEQGLIRHRHGRPGSGIESFEDKEITHAGLPATSRRETRTRPRS